MSERQQLHGHVTAEMLKAPLVGHLQPTVELTLTVGLVIDGNALAEKAMQVSDPQSGHYPELCHKPLVRLIDSGIKEIAFRYSPAVSRLRAPESTSKFV
jgi:hypothetical protein